MDASLSELERRLYVSWLHSPSVFSDDPTETILAFKISRILSYPGSRVLKALRGQPGLDEELVRRVEAFVAADPTLRFVQEGERRRIVLVE